MDLGNSFCIWDDLLNPKIRLNLIPNHLKQGNVGDNIKILHTQK